MHDARRDFEEALLAEPDETLRCTLALRRAAAWYRVTYDPGCVRGPNESASGSTGTAPLDVIDDIDARLLSFPWILAQYLAAIKVHGGA
jgi:hypothetical protein